MKLTWHLVKKDLQRMALPVAAWVAFTVAAAAWFAGQKLPAAVARAGDFSSWVIGIGGLAMVVAGMEMVTGVLLAAFLVLEDGLVGTTAQWQTRPISGGRMLGAKLLAALLLLVIAPAVALVPVWAAWGFSAEDCTLAAAEFAGWQIAVTVLAMGLAALAKDLGEFVFATMGAAVAFAVGATKPLFQLLGVAVSEGFSGKAVILMLPVAVLGAVLVQQYLTRRRGRGWALVGAGLAAVVLVRVAGAGDFLPQAKPPAGGDQGRVLTELPLRVGASANGVRIAGLTMPDFRQPLSLAVEERGRWEKFDGPVSVRTARDSATARAGDYVLVNRRLGIEQPLTVQELDAAGLNSMLLTVRRLETDSLPSGWEDGAVLRIVDHPGQLDTNKRRERKIP